MSNNRNNPFYNMPRAPGVPDRWSVTIWYETDFGVVDVVHHIEEIDMLHDIVERGPNFNTITKIEIVRNK